MPLADGAPAIARRTEGADDAPVLEVEGLETVFDTRDLASGEMRAGCLAYGQWRHYKISTATINDARLDLEVSLGRVRLRLRLSLRVRGTLILTLSLTRTLTLTLTRSTSA